MLEEIGWGGREGLWVDWGWRIYTDSGREVGAIETIGNVLFYFENVVSLKIGKIENLDLRYRVYGYYTKQKWGNVIPIVKKRKRIS
jgi:hypothetical protein